jgi:hypothetical protein
MIWMFPSSVNQGQGEIGMSERREDENPFDDLFVSDPGVVVSTTNQQEKRSKQDKIQQFIQEAKQERQQGALQNQNEKGREKM